MEKTFKISNENHSPATDNSDIHVDSNKKAKGRKGPNNSKKTGNSDNQETLIAQKYYISSLEGKVNHLENLIKVMGKTVENNSLQSHRDESIPPAVSGGHSNRSSCACSEQINFKLLENRLLQLESQNQMWINLQLQNQLQLQTLVR